VTRRPLTARRRVVFSIVALLAFFLLSEGILWGVSRAAYWSKVSRHNESAAAQQEGTFTIATFGDSVTAGQGTAPAYSYPRQLDDLLNTANGGGFRVVNHGVFALNSSRLADLLPQWLEETKPDLIVVMVGCNNGWNFRNSHLDEIGLMDRPLLLQWLDRTRTYRFLRLLLKRRKGGVTINQAPEPVLYDAVKISPSIRPPVDPTAATHEGQNQLFEDAAAMEELLHYDYALILERAQAAGADVLFMSYPFEPYGHEHRDVTIEFAGKNHLLFTDNFTAFEHQHKVHASLDLFSADRGHPNATGYRVVAAGIYESMRQHQDRFGLSLAETPDPLADFKDPAYLETLLQEVRVSTEAGGDEYAWEARGHLEMELDLFRDAERSFRTAFKKSHGAPAYFESLAWLFVREKNWDGLRALKDEMSEMGADRSDIEDLLEMYTEDGVQ
jgi:lysophospholipase L1-like esterase